MSNTATATSTEWLSYEEACERVDISRSTMNKWRVTGRGPTWKKFPNGRLRIRAADLDAWVDGLPEVA